MALGRIECLWRYPVKSLLGESLTQSDVGKRGLYGDRLYAIYNQDNKLGSGKNSRRFKKMDGLFKISAQLTKSGVVISLASGETIENTNATINEKLSAELGQVVTLTKEHAISHFDDSPVHIITSADLAKLKSLIPESKIDLRRFRANILIDSNSPSHDLLGLTIKIGNTELKIAEPTERCRMICLPQGELDYDPKILRAVAKEFELNFGVYALVSQPGSIKVGDSVSSD